MWLVHLVLFLSWGCFALSLRLPAFSDAHEGVAASGLQWLFMSLVDPFSVPVFGVINGLIVTSPLWFVLVGRRCPGWLALAGCAWSFFGLLWMFALVKPQIGLWAWSFSLCLFASWLALCWLGTRRRRRPG